MTDTAMNSRRKKWPRWTGIILPLCIAASFAFLVSLGNWQMQRLVQKTAMIERAKNNIKSAPNTINQVEAVRSEGGDIEYMPVQTTGRFLHQKEQFFFNTYKGFSGWNVYTPLERSDGSIVFVNRGFVPMLQKDPQKRLEGQIEGVVTIVGLARADLMERPNPLVPDNDLPQNIFYWKNLAQMSENAGFGENRIISKFFVDANDTPNIGGLPVGGVTLLKFPNNHLQYALTWYGLAGALLVVGLIFMFKRRSESN